MCTDRLVRNEYRCIPGEFTMDDSNSAADGDDADAEPDVPAEWMAPPDEDILEAMCDEDVFTPDHIDDEGICRGPHAATRCRKLAEYGLLEKHAMGMYDITDLGERYLAGEVDPTELEPEE